MAHGNVMTQRSDLRYSHCMDWNTETIETYDKSAKELAEYFKGIGARTEDIERAIELAHAGSKARVVEIGCGDGRDAEEIVPRVAFYEGYDPSEGLLEIARKRLPGTSFIKADALTYNYPENLDVVYAFASLLHVDKTDFKRALEKIAAALRTGGIAYISLKERPAYEAEVREDEFGKRMFYYYHPTVVKALAEDLFEPVHEAHYTIGHGKWFRIALRKK